MEVPKIDDRDKNVQRVDTGESPIEFEATRVLHPEVDKEVPAQAEVKLSAQDNLDQAFKKLRKPGESSSPKDAASLAAERGLKTIRPYLFAAEPKNVEDMATALRLSKEFGVAPALASAQKDFFDKTSRANRIDSDPAFADWASQSEDNTSLAAQFPEEIGKAIASAGALGRLIELGNERYTPDTPGGRLEWEARRETVQRSLSRTFAGLGPEEEYDESLLAAVPRGLASGTVDLFAGASEGINYPVEAAEEHFDGTASRRGKLYGEGQGPSERLSIEGKPIGSLDSLERIASARESFREFSSTLKGNYQPGTFGALLGDMAAVVPQFAFQVLLGVATGGVGTLAGKAGQALLMGEQIFGSSYSGYRSDGVGVDAAALGAGLNAVLQTPFEIIGVKYLPFGKLAGLTRGQATRRITGAFLAEPATETLQGLVQYGVDAEVYGLAGGRSQAEIGGWLSDNLSGVFKSSLYQGLVAGPFGLASGIANVRAINQANNIRVAEDKTFEHVQALPFKDKLPGMAEAVARHAGANYNWQVAGSDVQALYQVHPALLEKLGIRISEVEEATAMGQPVPIDAARAMAVLSPEEYNAVKPVVQGFEYGPDRFVDMVTEEEIEQENSRITEMAEAEQKERADFRAEQERLKTELVGSVKDVEGLRKQAVSTGKSVGNVADSVLELMSRMAKSIAERSGEKPADILRRINVQSERSAFNNRGTFDANDPRILYQESDPLGSLQVQDNTYLVTLFKDANLSTLLHETVHIFLEEMERIASLEMADIKTIEDFNTLKEWWSRFDDDVELKREYDARVKNTPRFDGKDFESLAPDEKADARKIVEKEYFARGFEKYLLEGEAPSSKLREVFQRFRKWLLRIYGEAAKALGVELNPDVRRVFDRLLASDMEVEHAAIADQMFTLTDSMKKALGLSDEQAARHMVLLEEAKAAAMDTVIKKRGQDSREREKRWKEEAEAALAKDPAYASLARVRGDRVGVLKLSTEAVKEMYGEDYYKAALKKLGPGVFLKEGGNNPDDVAYILGFGSGQLMIDAWLNNPSKTAAVKARMEGRRADFDSRVDPYEALLETQEAAIQAAVLGEYTASKVKESFKAIKQEVLKRIASDRFQDFKASKAVSPKQFLRNMELSGRRWAKLIAEKNFEGALKANTEYRLNLEFYKLAVAKKEGIKKAVKAIKRFTDKEKNPDGIVSSVKARYAVDFIAARFGLKNPNLTLQENKGVEDIQSWTEEADKAGYDIDISPMRLAGHPGDWREMSVEALDDLFTELLTIAAVDRDMKAIEIGGKREDIKAAAKEAADVIASHKRLRPLGSFEEDGVIISAARSLNMMHTKMEFMCELMDGGEAMGKNWQLVYNRMREAENKYTTMFKALSGRFKSAELFGMYTPRELEKMNSQVVAAGANQSLTKAKAIMVALNMGTESNMNRLETGLGLSRGEISRIVDTALDARDWKFVQGVWATFESYKEEAFGLEEKLTGRRPKSVPPRLVRTKFGNIQGGYFPIVYDPKRANPVQKERMQIGTRSIYSLTQKGHLKDRASQGAGTPLLLDMGVIARKLDDLVTDICFREPSRDVFKILNNNTYRETVRSAYGEQVYSRMVEWLEDSVKENKQQTGFDAFLRWGRIGGTTVAMGLKVTTIAQQVLGLLQSWDRIGIKALLKGFAGVYSTDIQKTAENFRVIREKSAFMDARMGNYDRDMKDAFTTFNSPDATPQGVIDAGLKKVGLSRPIKAVQKVSFKPIAAVQYYAVDAITWMGAYQQAIQKFHGDENKSVAYADQSVRMTQGSGDTLDLASIQRGGELAKAATMFYSYFNVLYNLAGLRVADVARNRDAASVGRAAQSFMLLVIVPALLGEYLSGRGWEGDDDEDELPAWVVKNLAAYSLGVSPFTRWTTGAMEGFGVNFTGATRGAESLINLINQIKKVDEMDGKKAAKYALQLSGYALALPAGQAEITLFNLIDYMDGTTQDYELRDLIFRRQESRR